MSASRLVRLFLAVAIMATVGVLLRGYITDDTFIHLRYAENLISRGEFSFNPGENTYGATSPLWIFGLALLLKLGFSPFTAAWLLGVIAGLSVVIIFDAIIERLSIHPYWKCSLLILAVCDSWFLRWTFSGMETPAATAVLLLLLWPLVSGRDMSWGTSGKVLWHRYLGWGVASGLAGLIRPEFMVIAPLALPWLLWFEYFRVSSAGGASERYLVRPHQPIVAAFTGWAVVIVPWLIFAKYSFGRFTPGTAAAKSNALSFDPIVVFGYLWRTIQQLAATQGLLWLGVIALIFLVIFRNREQYQDQPQDQPQEQSRMPFGVGNWSVWGPVALMGIAGTWSVVLLGGYAVKQVWIISRYVAPIAPVLLLAMAVITEWLMGGRYLGDSGRRIGRVIVVFVVVATVLSNGWILLTQVRPHAQKFPAGVKECYLGYGQWLKDNSDPDAVVAALDIGAVGYASERRVLDLMGLVSPEILEMGQAVGFAEVVESGNWLLMDGVVGGRHPDYLVDRSEGPPRWSGKVVHGVHFELLETCIIEGVGLREPQPWVVSLYKLESVVKQVNSSTGG